METFCIFFSFKFRMAWPNILTTSLHQNLTSNAYTMYKRGEYIALEVSIIAPVHAACYAYRTIAFNGCDIYFERAFKLNAKIYTKFIYHMFYIQCACVRVRRQNWDDTLDSILRRHNSVINFSADLQKCFHWKTLIFMIFHFHT